MSGGTYLFLGAIIYFAYLFFKMSEKGKRNAYYEDLKKRIPIYYTENFGKEFIVLENLSSSNEDKMEAEINLMEQAEKQNANAIIVLNNNIESQIAGGVSVSRGFIDNKARIKDTTHLKNTFHYNAIAIKIVDDTNEKVVDEKNQNNLDAIVKKIEEDSLIEFDKLKKLLESGIIDEVEYQNRINTFKNEFIQKKEELIYSTKLKNAIKELEDEANIKFEKQKKLFNMNLIDKKEYEEKMTSIENELNERKKDLKI
jgi:hypothetical protein